MVEKYDTGIAFIVEGDTEKEFYLSLLEFLCKKHRTQIDRVIDEDNPDVVYTITINSKKMLIKFHTVNAVSQMPRAGKWFSTQCLEKSKKIDWFVFLCYDTDQYMENVSKFHEGDWATLHQKLKKAKVIHVAASADIEDIMLIDLKGICAFISCDIPEKLVGRKGKVKLKNLYRANGKAYHEGKRARPLINSLDMQFIMDNATIPLYEIEQYMFN